MNPSSQVSEGDLRKAFETFSRISSELDHSYKRLETRVSFLTRELALARESSRHEKREKHRLADRVNELIELLPGAVVVLDRHSRVKECNRAAEEFFGSGLQGMDWIGLYLTKCDEVPDATGECHLRTGQVLTIQTVELQRGDRLLLATDITESRQKQIDRARRVRLERLGEMAACLAHQIRTPLSSATLYLSQLRHPSLEAGDRKRIQGKLNDSLSHMANLVTSILDVARDRGIATTEIRLSDLVDEFAGLMRPQLDAVGGCLQVVGRPQDYLLRANQDDLVGALVNMGMNAIQWAGQGALLQLQLVSNAPGWLELRLVDNGPGISPQVLEHVFDPFFTTRASGNGLGLAVAANVIEGLGGHIQASNTDFGGACLAMSLPARYASANAAEVTGTAVVQVAQ